MRKDPYGFIPAPVKVRKPRLKKCRYDEFQDMIEWKTAYGNGFFSPALKQIIQQRIYNKT